MGERKIDLSIGIEIAGRRRSGRDRGSGVIAFALCAGRCSREQADRRDGQTQELFHGQEGAGELVASTAEAAVVPPLSPVFPMLTECRWSSSRPQQSLFMATTRA